MTMSALSSGKEEKALGVSEGSEWCSLRNRAEEKCMLWGQIEQMFRGWNE